MNAIEQRDVIELVQAAEIAVNQIICMGGDGTCQPCENRERLAKALDAGSLVFARTKRHRPSCGRKK